eukprot:492643_1
MGSTCCTCKTDKWDDHKMRLIYMNAKKKSITSSSYEIADFDSEFIILQIGLFPFQSQLRSTHNSSTLHELYHNAINSINGYKSYSIFPSISVPETDTKKQINVKYIEVEEIPTFETNPKWSSKSESFINEFQNNMEDTIYDFMIDIENTKCINTDNQSQNQKISLIICHHPFINHITLANVIKRRNASGLHTDIKIASFVHDDILKIYEYELDNNNNEYVSNFYDQITDSQLFESNQSTIGNVDIVYSISTEITDKFTQLFPLFNTKNVIYNTLGFSPMFKKSSDNLCLMDVLKAIQLKPEVISETDDYKCEFIGDNQNYKYLIMFSGTLDEWKRIECLIYAANEYEKVFGDEILTLIVAKGMNTKENNMLKELSNELGNKNTYFVDIENQNILVKLYNVCDVGVFPMKDEHFGMIIIECLACGTPVIATNSGHSTDFVDDIVGKLIEENDDHKILGQTVANAVIDCIKNNDKEKKSNNCVKVAEPYGVEAKVEIMLNHTLQMYNRQ